MRTKLSALFCTWTKFFGGIVIGPKSLFFEHVQTIFAGHSSSGSLVKASKTHEGFEYTLGVRTLGLNT